ncbi:DUF368 domain-containing protein [Cellulosilyticum ruminicola]|uniref:DUF368 domain-containing protein n=1 Tax=Cellulosilyticum ruminicola TaxID=425254 RepID=UPI0006D01F05|nr:DUF368 domain-containing protein [Cellulosilyticum ruminicola]
MEFIWNMIYGAIIGIANIIPGVSGGTMAVILNIYDELISAVSNFTKSFKKSLTLLIPIGIGAGIGIILFSKLIGFLLETYPMPLNFFFMGLIIGSIPMIYKRATVQKFKVVSLIPFVITVAIMAGMSFLSKDEAVASALITTVTFGTALKLIACGAIAAACTILPGVSGSLILVVLGIYTSVLNAIDTFNIPVLFCVGIGVLIGLLGGAKLIDICLRTNEQLTFFAILGLVVGSVVPVFKASGFAFGVQAVVSIVTLALGMGISLLFASEKFQAHVRRNKELVNA